MRYAVLYDSETGNTRKLAEHIFQAIDSASKTLVDLRIDTQMPQADLYFVGFPIHKKNCGMRIVDCLEQIETGKVVLFGTCGMKPTEKYKQKLEESLGIWLSDDVEYLGLFLCQGRTTEAQKNYFCDSNPEYREKIKEMMNEGDRHPNENDFADAARYVKSILQDYGE
jgi:flavodoxin